MQHACRLWLGSGLIIRCGCVLIWLGRLCLLRNVQGQQAQRLHVFLNMYQHARAQQHHLQQAQPSAETCMYHVTYTSTTERSWTTCHGQAPCQSFSAGCFGKMGHIQCGPARPWHEDTNMRVSIQKKLPRWQNFQGSGSAQAMYLIVMLGEVQLAALVMRHAGEGRPRHCVAVWAQLSLHGEKTFNAEKIHILGTYSHFGGHGKLYIAPRCGGGRMRTWLIALRQGHRGTEQSVRHGMCAAEAAWRAHLKVCKP